MKSSAKTESSSDPRVHSRNIRGLLDEVITQVRADLKRVSGPKAQVLFETGAAKGVRGGNSRARR